MSRRHSSVCRAASRSSSSVPRSMRASGAGGPGVKENVPSAHSRSRNSAFSPSTAPARASTGRPSTSSTSPRSFPRRSDTRPVRRASARVWSRSGSAAGPARPQSPASRRRRSGAVGPREEVVDVSEDLVEVVGLPEERTRPIPHRLRPPPRRSRSRPPGWCRCAGLVRRMSTKVRASSTVQPWSKSTRSGWREHRELQRPRPVAGVVNLVALLPQRAGERPDRREVGIGEEDFPDRGHVPGALVRLQVVRGLQLGDEAVHQRRVRRVEGPGRAPAAALQQRVRGRPVEPEDELVAEKPFVPAEDERGQPRPRGHLRPRARGGRPGGRTPRRRARAS